MRTKRIFKALELIFITTVMLIVITVTFYIVRSNNYDEDYQDLKLNTSIEIVQHEWGKPDRITYDNNLMYLFYNDGLMTDYVFKFDKKSKKLVEKWTGD